MLMAIGMPAISTLGTFSTTWSGGFGQELCGRLTHVFASRSITKRKCSKTVAPGTLSTNCGKITDTLWRKRTEAMRVSPTEIQMLAMRRSTNDEDPRCRFQSPLSVDTTATSSHCSPTLSNTPKSRKLRLVIDHSSRNIPRSVQIYDIV